MIVVGGGVIGLEYAIMFATLGVQVTVVDGREQLLEFCDREIVDTLLYHARSLGMVFRLGENVVGIHKLPQGLVSVELESGKRLLGETVLFSVGRVGDTVGPQSASRPASKPTNAAASGATNITKPGCLTSTPSATSSVSRRWPAPRWSKAAAPPATPSASRSSRASIMPYGLFTIPEISMVGQKEEQLTAERVPYEVGIARYSEIARGHIAGDTTGMLKLLFHRDTRKLLGVHGIGESATEIVHIGQAVMAFGGTIDYFRDTVFNYPDDGRVLQSRRLRRPQQAELRRSLHDAVPVEG